MKKVLLAILSIALAVTGLSLCLSAAEDTLPSAEIIAKNVSYADSVKMLFAVEAKNYDTAELQIFPEDTVEFTEEKVGYTVSTYSSSNVNGKDVIVFYSNGISAKNLVDSFFARVKVTKGEVTSYSEIQRYSVVQYLNERLWDAKYTADQKELYLNLLNYGASAQKVLNYRTDRLATDEYFLVFVNNGMFIDGENAWFAHKGDALTMTASMPDGGNYYVKWTNGSGNTIGTSPTITVTAEDVTTYTAHWYDEDTFIEFVLSDDKTHYTVAGVDESFMGSLVIPDTYNGLPVTAIDNNAFTNNSNLTSVVIPEGITVIGQSAFSNCTALDSLKLPSSLTSIKLGAFSGCSSLETVWFRGTVNDWGLVQKEFLWAAHSNDFIVYCTDGNVNSDGDILSSALGLEYQENSDGTMSVIGIGSNTDKDIVIPEYWLGLPVTKIADAAFESNFSIISVRIPSTVTDIGEKAFIGCDDLEKVIGGEGIQTIGSRAFEFCLNLKEITLPVGLKDIGSKAFYNCDNLKEITLPDGLKSIGASAFSWSALHEITIPGDIESMSECVFKACDEMVRVTLGEGITTIPQECFAMLSGGNIKEVRLPHTLTMIETEAFYNCFDLETIIYNGTVSEWENIKEKFGVAWDRGVNVYTVCTIYCTDGFIRDWKPVYYSTGLEYSENADGTYSLTGLGECADTTVIIPSVFNGKPVTTIAEYAFTGSTVTKVVFGINLTSVEERAFSQCENLEEVTLVGHGTWVCDCGDDYEPVQFDTTSSVSGVVAQYFKNWRASFQWKFESEF